MSRGQGLTAAADKSLIAEVRARRHASGLAMLGTPVVPRSLAGGAMTAPDDTQSNSISEWRPKTLGDTGETDEDAVEPDRAGCS
jgi:hypothetical protein